MRTPTLPNAASLAGLALRCQSDPRLAGLAREGQPRAFEEIVRRYRQPLVSYAGTIVPPDRAEDVVQEALTKAHTALMASESEVKLKPWLYAIVRNRALNDLRDQPTHELLEESFDGVAQPPEVVAGRDRLAVLIGQLRDLPQAQREALIQRELEGRSHREIGESLGVTPGAARGLIFRARTALRDVAGMLIPLPVLRALLNADPYGAEATGAVIGAAAATLTTGGGGGVAAKAGATLAVAALAVGSGAAIENRGDGGGDRGVRAFAARDQGRSGQGVGGQENWSGGSKSSSRSAYGSGSSSGPGLGDGSSHGSGASDDVGDTSGPGGDGPGSGEEDRDEGGDGHEGPGGDEPETATPSNRHGGDSSGSGSGHESSGSGGSGGSGSGSSGSGSSGSVSSGSGSESSGSGSSSSGSSTSGSSGSGSSGSGSGSSGSG